MLKKSHLNSTINNTEVDEHSIAVLPIQLLVLCLLSVENSILK